MTSSDAEQVKLRELEIDAKTAREQLESYLTKYREAIARDADNAAPANGRIIARALSPASPSFPKAGSMLLLAPLAALCASLGLVVAKILLTDGAPAAASPARREQSLPFGIDPPPPAAEPERGDDRQAWIAEVERFADRLADTADGESLPVMVAGEDGALPAALATARRLTRRGATALVDLGPSPDWLPDLFDRERDGDGEGQDFAAQRDLSTSLDIFPSAQGEIAAQDIADRLEALSANTISSSCMRRTGASPPPSAPMRTWRRCSGGALGRVSPPWRARVRAAYRDAGLAIKAVGTDAPPADAGARGLSGPRSAFHAASPSSSSSSLTAPGHVVW